MPEIPIEEAYATYRSETPRGVAVREAIDQATWLYNVLDFDPLSGEALPQALSQFLCRLVDTKPQETLHDRLWRIIAYSGDSFRRIIRNLREQPQTEHARLHVTRVREMDASSYIKLANRTGRTIREKLANDPFVTSVRHYQSVDILENRLLKAYALRMSELLEARVAALFEEESSLLVDIRTWLRSDEARSISAWANLPPNNALISHRDYRRIWRAWRWMQTLSEVLGKDVEAVQERRKIITFWNGLAKAFSRGELMLADMPLIFDYDDFQITSPLQADIHVNVRNRDRTIPLGGKLPESTTRVAPAPMVERPIKDTVCVDFTTLAPQWTVGQKVESLPIRLIWQRWDTGEGGMVPMSLYRANAVWLNEQASTVSMRDLLMPHDISLADANQAAVTFLDELTLWFESPKLIWLVPDCVNDFDLVTLRSNINSRYQSATQVPRSIATVFQKILPKYIHDGYKVTVLDEFKGYVFATPIVARWHSSELKKKMPQSMGCYWERQPTILLFQKDEDNEERFQPLSFLDTRINWRIADRGNRNSRLLEYKKRFIDHNHKFQGTDLVFADENSVQGGLELYKRQSQLTHIPLWRDHLPDLDMVASSGKRMLRIHLVSDKTIIPHSQKKIPFQVDGTFTLPAGHKEYTFFLYQGNGNAKLHYQAYLAAPSAFPCKDDVECRLQMTYTYGANNPYELRFVPTHAIPSFPKSILVEWRPINTDDAPVPDFPRPISWEDFVVRKKRHSLEAGIEKLEQYSSFLHGGHSMRQFMRLPTPLTWRKDRYENNYALVNWMGKSIAFFENDFEKLDPAALEISFDVQKGRNLYAKNITLGHTVPREWEQWVYRRLCVPAFIAFSVIRTEESSGFPPDFWAKLNEGIKYAKEMYTENIYAEKTARNILLFLATCNANIPEHAVRNLLEILDGKDPNKYRDYKKIIAYSIGDAQQEWQKAIFERVLLKRPLNISYEILGIAFWRARTIVHRLSWNQVDRILSGLEGVLSEDCKWIEKIQSKSPLGRDADKAEKNKFLAAKNTLARHLELLLALLRTRESSDNQIRRIIWPGSTHAIALNDKVDSEIGPMLERGGENFLRSRIDLQLEKPMEFQKTPDLLYALKLYLTGDDGANTIVINGISEDED